MVCEPHGTWRSPAPYATFGSRWLLTPLATERGTMMRQGSLMLLGFAFCLIIDEEGLPPLIPSWLVGLTLGIQRAALEHTETVPNHMNEVPAGAGTFTRDRRLQEISSTRSPGAEEIEPFHESNLRPV